MISKECTKIFTAFLFLFVFVGTSVAQITEGRIVYERKTNLKKIFGDDERMARFITEENKIRIEKFEVLFNDTSAVYRPIPEEESTGGGFMMKYMTTHNTVYQNTNTNEKLIVMDLWGTETLLKDTLEHRDWVITENTRSLGGHECRKAYWEVNDSTRIYAWFTVDIVSTIGPEGFFGLPGAILGLATEDGSIIYFAQEVEAKDIEEELLDPEKASSGKDIYSKSELKAILLEKMGRWMKEDDLDGMFMWL